MNNRNVLKVLILSPTNAGALQNIAKEIAEFFDNLDDYADEMLTEYSGKEAQAFVGKELKLSKTFRLFDDSLRIRITIR